MNIKFYTNAVASFLLYIETITLIYYARDTKKNRFMQGPIGITDITDSRTNNSFN